VWWRAVRPYAVNELLSRIIPQSTSTLRREAPPRAPLHVAQEGTLADELVSELVEAGIDTYFGVPGGAIEPLFDALARQQDVGRVRLVAMRSEAGAAFAADGYYRQTGRLAVCTATTGPGVSNLLTATMSAHADRVPMLVLTPQVAAHKQGRGALQESSMDGYDLPHVFSTATKYSSIVTHPDQLRHKLARALSIAQQPPAGPVQLSISSDLLRAPAAAVPRRLHRSGAPPAPVDSGSVELLVRDLLAAHQPVFYVGDDAGPGVARVLDLARVLGAAVVSSPAGKRWLGHLHGSYAGVIGFSGHAEAQQAVNCADLIVAFGATFDELSTNAWTALPAVRLYAVDRHAEFAYRLDTARPVIAAAEQVLERLATALGQRPAAPERRQVSGVRARVRPPGAGPVHPAHLMHWLTRVLADDVVVHVDAGNSFSWSTRELLRPEPDTYRVAMGFSTMCWAISAAIGAAIARPRRTLCICGDGSMLMSSLELTVAVEQQLPVSYVILNDAGLGMVRHGQRLAGARSIATEIAPVRFDELARACGAQGIRVQCAADLEAIDAHWFTDDAGGPIVIDVRIDREAVPPMAERVRGLQSGAAR
jgi:acetolactate synthase-1/2/3 large subunit